MELENLPEFDIPVPVGSEPKEVYAFFGLAAYWAQVLEREVINFAVAVQMTTASELNRKIVEELWAGFQAKTFGSVLRGARRLTAIPTDIDALLGEALAKRNHLIHGFFWDHARDFLSDAGRVRMMADLQAHMKTFKLANDRLEPITLQILTQFGVSRKKIDRIHREMIVEAESEDP